MNYKSSVKSCLLAGRRQVILSLRFTLLTSHVQEGFTFVEAILYVAIISIMLTALIPFTINVIEGQRKSATQEEVSSQARMISERIKWEIRNAISIVSVSSNSLTLCESSGCINNTVISLSGGTLGNVQINPNGTGVVQLNSNDVTVPTNGLTFTNNSSSTTKNVSFSLTLQQAGTQKRNEFKQTETIQSSAELRNL